MDIPGGQEIDSSGLNLEDALDPIRKINRYWLDIPPEEHIHVLVRAPASKYPVS